MPSPGGQFFSDEFNQDIEDYFITDYWLIDQYIGDRLWLWGFNDFGQLGNNSVVARSTPITTLLGGTDWKQVSSGLEFTSAIKINGTLWIWGSGTYGQLGNNSVVARSTPITTLLGGTDWKQVSSGNRHCASIKTDGTLWTWGLNNLGHLGINVSGAVNTSGYARTTPVTTLLGGTNWKQVSCGDDHTAAIKTDGTLWLWGGASTNNGLIGDNNLRNRSTPVTTFLGGTNWKQVSCGSGHTVAIKTDGTLWVWGDNTNGTLGINDTAIIGVSIPITTILGGNNWKEVSAGSGFNAAIKTDGTLWVWGRNNQGQLGINNIAARSIPITTILGGTNWKEVVCSRDAHIAAIKTDGTLWTWGKNSYGQVGDNTLVSRSTPVTTILGGNNWKHVNCGNRMTSSVQLGLEADLR